MCHPVAESICPFGGQFDPLVTDFAHHLMDIDTLDIWVRLEER